VVCDNIVANNSTTMVSPDNWVIDEEASFFCMCSNETVNGFEINFDTFPWEKIPSDIPVCVDMSSNIGTCNIPWDKVGVVYAGAQKNLGTSGCTVVIVREDLFGKKALDTPILCDWEEFENSPDKTYNTPAVYPMYITGINCSYMN
jgi:phosphoserine aminotransferase